jgi:hypothetical protein
MTRAAIREGRQKLQETIRHAACIGLRSLSDLVLHAGNLGQLSYDAQDGTMGRHLSPADRWTELAATESPSPKTIRVGREPACHHRLRQQSSDLGTWCEPHRAAGLGRVAQSPFVPVSGTFPELLKFSAKCDIMSSAQNLVSTERCSNWLK